MQSTRKARQFVRELRVFGEQELGLRFDGSFRRFDNQSPAANWLYTVYADRLASAHPGGDTFRFTWSFSQARRWERRQQKSGHHTYLYSAEAHGGRACPITPSLLTAARARQAYVVMHEAWHSTLRLQQIKMPYPLEEATGRIVGVMGATLFAEARGESDLIRETHNQTKDWGGFSRWVNRSYQRLDRLYRRGSPKRDIGQARRAIAEEAKQLRRRTTSIWEHEELTKKINNAFMFRYYDYTRLYPLALRVFHRAGSLKRTMNQYQRAGRIGALAYLRGSLADR